MGLTRMLAVLLVILGIVVLVYSGITVKTPGKPVNIGPVHVETTQRHFIPPIAGGIALAVGIVLLVAGNKKG